MDLGIAGRTAAVAAASAGLGFWTASALAEEGVRVAICGRDRGRVDEAVARIGHDAIGLVADVGSAEGATGFIEAATEALDHLDIVVTNAGGPPPGTFASTALDAYEPAVALNLLSVVAMCKAAIPSMQQRKWGRVVAITSISVRQPIESLILSNTARAGATGFLKTVAREVAGDRVTVNSVQPALHATDRMTSLYGGNTESAARGIPAGFVGRPEDFGAIVAFICSEHAKYLTGAAINVDGGSYLALQ